MGGQEGRAKKEWGDCVQKAHGPLSSASLLPTILCSPNSVYTTTVPLPWGEWAPKPAPAQGPSPSPPPHVEGDICLNFLFSSTSALSPASPSRHAFPLSIGPLQGAREGRGVLRVVLEGSGSPNQDTQEVARIRIWAGGQETGSKRHHKKMQQCWMEQVASPIPPKPST